MVGDPERIDSGLVETGRPPEQLVHRALLCEEDSETNRHDTP